MIHMECTAVHIDDIQIAITSSMSIHAAKMR